MNIMHELKHQAALHPLRYIMSQGTGAQVSTLETGSVNQGSIRLVSPKTMVRWDAVKDALSSGHHPINKSHTLLSRKIAQNKFKQADQYFHRFDLLALSGRVQVLLGPNAMLIEKWMSFVRPNGAIYQDSKAVVMFFRQFFERLHVPLLEQRALLSALPVTYVNVQAIGWKQKYSEEIEKFFSKGLSVPSVVIKECSEGVREIGTGKLVAALKLDAFAFSGIGVTTPQGKSALLMPKVDFEEVCCAADIRETQLAQLLGIGLLHALLHVQDGGWENIAYIDGKLRAYDLGRSCIPARTIPGIDTGDKNASFVSLMNAEREIQITLRSALFDTPWMSRAIPDEIVNLFRDDHFITTVKSIPLGALLDFQDPLKVHKKSLRLSEKQFLNRAKKLYHLCQEGRPITLEEVFIKLYPDEMRFINAAKKLKIFKYRAIFPERILDRARACSDLFSKDEIESLEQAFTRLKSATMPLGKYQSFYT